MNELFLGMIIVLVFMAGLTAAVALWVDRG